MSVDQRWISIIEDEESLRMALIGFMKSLGYEAKGFESAEAFMDALSDPPPACIITDIHMSGLSGIALKDVLNSQNNDTPVIMITGRREPGLRERALATGAICFLTKPFAMQDLVTCVERALMI